MVLTISVYARLPNLPTTVGVAVLALTAMLPDLTTTIEPSDTPAGEVMVSVLVPVALWPVVVQLPIILLVHASISASTRSPNIAALVPATATAGLRMISIPLILILLTVVIPEPVKVNVKLEVGMVRKLVKPPSLTALHAPAAGFKAIVAAPLLHQRIGAGKVCVAVATLELIQLVKLAVVQCSPGTLLK